VAGTGNANRDREINGEEIDDEPISNENPHVATIEAELAQWPVEAEEVRIDHDKRKYLPSALILITTLLIISAVVVGGVCGTGACSRDSTIPFTPLAPLALCDIDVTLDCQTLNGKSCADIGPPYTASCIDGSGGGIVVLEFCYHNGSYCSSTKNTQGNEAICVDSAPLVAEPVDIRCTHYTPYSDLCRCCKQHRELTVAPEKVFPGDMFTLSSPYGGQLPQKVECKISYYYDLLQTIVIDTSGTVGLNLGDKFGSLQVETCNALTCLEHVRYIVQSSNVGRDPVFITDMNLTTQNEAWNLTNFLQQDSLSPGESTFVEQRVEINTCSGLEFSSQADVIANLSSNNGEMLCEDSDKFVFEVAPFPAVPAFSTNTSSTNVPTDYCVLWLEADCVFGGDDCFTGLPCGILYVGLDPCLPPPESIQMLYNGGGCEASDPDPQSQDAFSCKDFNGGPSYNEGEQSHILVKSKNAVYFNEVVTVGDVFQLNTNSSLIQEITISTPDNNTVLQEIQYHTSCLVYLNDRYGSLQLVSKTLINDSFGTFNFGKDAIIPITVAGENVTLTSLTINTNFAGDFDFSDQVAGKTVGPGGDVVVTLEGQIDTSYQHRFTLFYYMEGTRNADGELCTGDDMVSFLVGNDPSLY